MEIFTGADSNKKKYFTFANQGREMFDYFHEVKEELPKINSKKEFLPNIKKGYQQNAQSNYKFRMQNFKFEKDNCFQQIENSEEFKDFGNLNQKLSSIKLDSLIFKTETDEICSRNSGIKNDKSKKHHLEFNKKLNIQENQSALPLLISNQDNLSSNSKHSILNNIDNIKFEKAYDDNHNNNNNNNNNQNEDLKFLTKHKTKDKFKPDIENRSIDNEEQKGEKEIHLNCQILSKFEIDNKNECMTQRNLVEIEESAKVKEFYASNTPKLECKCPFILIVDDQPFNRAPLVSFCKKQNLFYEEASDGEKAFTKVKKKTENNCCKVFSFIFLDFNMPGINGVQTAKKIR